MRKRYFTLLELIVVMTIMFLAVSMGVAVFKGESPAKRLENASLDWRDFCARVRYQALESGSERVILFDPETKTFRMHDPNKKEGEEEQQPNDDEEDLPPPVKIEWKLPDKFELGSDFPDPNEEPDTDGCYLMFRFFPDGGASGKRKLELHIGELAKYFEISALTGRMTEKDEPDEDENGEKSDK